MKISYKNPFFTPFLIILVFFINFAFAQTTYTWNGGPAPWDSAANWTPVGLTDLEPRLSRSRHFAWLGGSRGAT